MNLSNLSWLGMLAGLAGIAGGLYLLQLLRVRHKQQVVITTMFWREAIEQSRARVFRQRFRHPWAYLLFLLIAGLMWLLVAGPKLNSSAEQQYVLLLDGSARMSFADRFADAQQDVVQQVARLPRDRTTVLLCGAYTTTVLAPGENPLLLEQRLASLSPQACPPALEKTVGKLVESSQQQALEIIIAGASTLAADFQQLLPENVTISRLGDALKSAGDANRGITQLGVAPAESGRWNRTDALLEVRGGDDQVASQLSITVAGRAFSGNLELVESASANGDQSAYKIFRLADLPADGEVLQVKLNGDDAITLDNQASLVLPNRPLIRVGLNGDVPAALRGVLAADSAVQIVELDQADLLIGDPLGGDARPALTLTSSDNEHAFFFRHNNDRSSNEVVREMFHRLGLDQIDAQSLAEDSGKIIRLGGEAGEQRGISIWDSLLSNDFDFIRSAAFPLFVGQSVRWLANQPEAIEYAAAGRTVDGVTSLQISDDRRISSGNDLFEPPTAGEYRSQTGRSFSASLLATEVTQDSIDTKLEATTTGKWRLSLITLVGCFCLGLLLCEWYLFRKGRLP